MTGMATPSVVDPRLEADLADLLTPERPAWLARAAAALAVPAAIVLLTALATLTLATIGPGWAVGGGVQPVASPATPTLPVAPHPPVGVSAGWVVAAEGLAATFAVDYLTPGDGPGHAGRLARYLAVDVDPTVGWHTPGRLVADSPVVVATRHGGPDQVSVTIALRLTDPNDTRWVHLRVPLGRDSDDRPAVIGLPHLTPAPATGTPTPPDSAADHDPALAALVESVVFDAARGDLQRIAEQTGFTATAMRLDRLTRTGEDTAVAHVDVDLVDGASGGALTQRLPIHLARTVDGWTATTGR